MTALGLRFCFWTMLRNWCFWNRHCLCDEVIIPFRITAATSSTSNLQGRKVLRAEIPAGACTRFKSHEHLNSFPMNHCWTVSEQVLGLSQNNENSNTTRLVYTYTSLRCPPFSFHITTTGHWVFISACSKPGTGRSLKGFSFRKGLLKPFLPIFWWFSLTTFWLASLNSLRSE